MTNLKKSPPLKPSLRWGFSEVAFRSFYSQMAFFRSLDMKSFFKTLLGAFVAVLSMSFAGLAAAQSTCVSGCLPSSPGAPMVGHTVGGWFLSGAVGFGETRGVGQLVTGEVETETDERFDLASETHLSSNTNPDCVSNCLDTRQTQSIIGASMASALARGSAGFNSLNCGAGGCPTTVSSVSQTGTNVMFQAVLFKLLAPTPMPTATSPPSAP